MTVELASTNAGTKCTQPLRPSQWFRLALLGWFFWFVGAMFIRWTTPIGFFGGSASAVLFIASLPAAWPMVESIRLLASLRRDQLVEGVAIASFVAMMTDGVALTWLPAVYGDVKVPATAWLLWGAAFILLVSVVEARRGQANPGPRSEHPSRKELTSSAG